MDMRQPKNKKKIARNDPCPCGSGRKYQFCCIAKELKERTVESENKCESCGSPLVYNLTDNWLNQYASQKLPLMNFCKDQHFYLFSMMNGRDEIFLNDKLKAETLTIKDFFGVYRAQLDQIAVRGYIEKACETNTAFSSRKKILLDACEAHFLGKFTLSVPVLFSQIEGILRDYGELDIKDDIRPTIPRNGWNAKLLFSMGDQVSYFNSFITELYKGNQDITSFNRNPILHGLNFNYDTEEYSLTLILTILEIWVFIEFRKKMEDVVH